MTLDSTIFIGIASIVALLVLLSLGVQIAAALAVVSIVGLLLTSGFKATVSLTAQTLYMFISNYSFVLVPLFILMGSFAGAAGIVRGAMRTAYTWLASVRGGLALATTLGCGFFAGVCGSSTATTAAIGKFIMPEMRRYGYDVKLATGTIAASGTLGILIPPSIVLVIYGVTCEESIGRLFIAGILPGVLSIVVYMIGITFVIYRQPQLAPPSVKFSWIERIKSIPGIWGILLIILIIWGGIYGGVFTPTEAGGISALTSFLILVSRVPPRRVWEELKVAIPEAVQTTGMVFILMVVAMLFSRFLTLAGVLDAALAFLFTREWSPIVMIFLICSVATIMGCFISAIAVLLLIAPTAHLILTSFGYSGIWLGIIMVKLFELANITPPVGINVYVVKGIAPDVPMEDIFKGIGMFAVMDVITIAILVAFPQISTWLPGTIY